jgi:hypothetical protein
LVILAVAFLVTLKRQQTKPRDDAYAPGTAAPEASIASIPSSTPVIATSARIEPAKTLPSLAGSTAAATKENPFINSLGMKFVPVPGTDVLFSIWETRVKDYQSFCNETGRSWDKPRFRQTPEHPAANVSWEDAKAFCEWLSEKEGRSYRLPTDHEWSCAVGIGDREDAAATPKAKSKKIADEYPWGEQWPPANDAGNYFGEECKTAEGLARLRAAGYEDASSWPALEGFNDGKLFISFTFSPT